MRTPQKIEISESAVSESANLKITCMANVTQTSGRSQAIIFICGGVPQEHVTPQKTGESAKKRKSESANRRTLKSLAWQRVRELQFARKPPRNEFQVGYVPNNALQRGLPVPGQGCHPPPFIPIHARPGCSDARLTPRVRRHDNPNMTVVKLKEVHVTRAHSHLRARSLTMCPLK